MPITYRLFDPETDYFRQAEIVNNTVRDQLPVTAEQLREFDLQRPINRLNQLWVAVNDNGLILGFSRIAQPLWLKDGDLDVIIRVDTAYRRQGIGTGLYYRLLAIAQQRQTRRLFTKVADYVPDALTFAEQFGFVKDRYIFDSRLDVAAFDETPFSSVIEAAAATGVTFTNLLALGDTSENRQKLYELDQRTAVDVPGEEQPYFATFELFDQALFPKGHALPDSAILALVGEEWVGFTALLYGSPETVYHFMTGVDRRYRGRKLALAVKLLSIRYAKQHGIKYLETSNDSANAPMLAINEKLGYQRLHGVYTLIKSLA